MYTTIKAYCFDQTLQVSSVPKLASGGKKVNRLEVTLNEYWDGYGKTAIFYRKKEQVYHVVMKNDACEIPHEVMVEPGVLYVGIIGTNGTSTRTSTVVALTVAQGAITGLDPFTPLPDVYQQVLAAYAEAEAGIAAETAERKKEVAVERARLDNLVAGGTPDGSELADVRVSADGTIYASAGEAVRANYNSLRGFAVAGITQPYNLMSPFACKNNTGLSGSTGAETPVEGQWCTGFMSVEPGMIAYSSNDMYKWIGYDDAMQYVSDYNYGAVVPVGVSYARAVYKSDVVSFDDRWFETVSHYGVFPRPVYTFEGVDLTEAFITKQIGNARIAASDFVVAGLTQKTNAITGKDFMILSKGTQRLVTPYPVRLLAGTTINVGTHLMRVYRCDQNRYWVSGDGSNLNTFTASEDMYVMISIAHETNAVLDSDLIADIIENTKVARNEDSAGSTYAFGEYRFSVPVTAATYMSDHTMINGQLYVINASSDDHTAYAGVTVYDVNPETKTSAYVRAFNHNLGHANSIDYCHGNGCLILGNGSSDATLPGEIYILPDAANKETWEYSDCIRIDVSEEGWGIKTNAVWGESNNGAYNIIYVITNNNANVRKLLLTKTDGVFDGGYVVLSEWVAPVIDVNQGTVYRNGKLYIAIGHSQIWALEYTLNVDGSVTTRQIKDVFYDNSGAVLGAPFSEGITIEDGYVYIGASDGRVLVYEMC